MNKNHFPPEKFAHIINTASEICAFLVKLCHDPNLNQMQAKVDAMQKKISSNAPSHAKTVETTKAQEEYIDNIIHLLIAHIHNPDKDLMLAKLHELSTIPPQEMIELVTKYAQEQANP